jgi:molybdopterin-guanine dinucleotide biosynthesis adapter protein
MKIFGFTGRSGSGKTTMIETLIPIFNGMGLSISVIKHTHHEFDVDQPGKDSWRQRHAGAMEVLLTSDMRWVLMHELRGAPEPDLREQLAHLSPCDLVLVEGFKRQPIPKLEVWRAANSTLPLYPADKSIVAIASDAKLHVGLPLFGLDDHCRIAEFIVRRLEIDCEVSRDWRTG